MIFWQNDTELSLVNLEDVRFDDLQSLVSYVLSDYKNQITKTKSEMIFQDPRLVMFEWDASEGVQNKSILEETSTIDEMNPDDSFFEVSNEIVEPSSMSLDKLTKTLI